MFTGENSKAYGGHKSTTSPTTRHVQVEETAGEVTLPVISQALATITDKGILVLGKECSLNGGMTEVPYPSRWRKKELKRLTETT